MLGGCCKGGVNALSCCKCGAVILPAVELLMMRPDANSCSLCLALAHLQSRAPQKAGIVRIPRPDRCVVGDRIPKSNLEC